MSTSKAAIRCSTVEDAETIKAFNLALALESEGLRLDPERVAEGVRVGLADAGKARYFLAELGGGVVGQLMVTSEWSDWRNAYFWWIQSVFVAPGFRSRGVFRALYGHVDTLARSQDDTCGLRLYVHHDNQSAIEVYRKLGMAITAYKLCEVDW